MPPPTQSTSIGAMAGTAMGARRACFLWQHTKYWHAGSRARRRRDAGDANAGTETTATRTHEGRDGGGANAGTEATETQRQQHKRRDQYSCTSLTVAGPRRCHRYSCTSLTVATYICSSTDATAQAQTQRRATQMRLRASAVARRRGDECHKRHGGERVPVTEGATKEQRGIAGKPPQN
jgi:hypothetical protein